ncbi:MAG: LamG domain-containing protein [Spirochaetia bacterium]|nr:LamG domain-containing protein [Spirochaetia bacterium]
MKTVTALLAALALLVALGSCTLFGTGDPLIDTPTDAQLESFSKVFMSSYWAERGGAPSGDVARAVTPFLPRSADSGAARATVPVDRLTESVLFSDLQPKTFPNYPEPGQTTSFTATLEHDEPTVKVYRIVVTTTFPSSDLRASYVEEYFVRDGDTSRDFTNPDGDWTDDDPIVDATWAQDQKHREKMELTFRDGTKRTETIVSASTAGGLKFSPAAFDIDGSLDLSQAFVPASSTDPNVMYSSVVMYYVTPASNPNYWFWAGSLNQTIFGVRFYTEVADPDTNTYTAYTASFERTLSVYTTESGDFADTVSGITVGSVHETLAESVFRQRVVYALGTTGTPPDDYYIAAGTGTLTSRMRTRVVNAAGLRDFILEQIDSEALAFSLADSTFFAPTGLAAEILAEDSTASVYVREQQMDYPDSDGILRFALDDAEYLGISEPLTTLYVSILTGTDTRVVDSAPVSNVLADNTVSTFLGARTMGTLIPYAEVTQTSNMGVRGTVESWVYIAKYTESAGIVHKGVELNFADEAFSLQGWGRRGQVGIVLDHGSDSSTYDSVVSSIYLNRGTWYHLVATWDAAPSSGAPYINLYINGALDASGTPTVSAYHSNDSDLLVGSQLPDIYRARDGYFGLDGKVTGVNVLDTALDGAAVFVKYNESKDNTFNW